MTAPTRIVPVVVILALVAPTWAVAQAPAPRPAFEVASIRRNTSNAAVGFATPQPGRFVVANVPLRALILRAYRLQPFQLTGGDDWLDTERYDITATFGAGGPADADLMLQSLLEERFGLVAHRETREGPVYHLVVARTDRRLGPKLTVAAADCDAGGRPRDPSPATATPQPLPAGFSSGVLTGCRSMRTPGWIMAAGQPMSAVATSLTASQGRPVIDRTGLAGNYDFSLAYLPDDERARTTTLPPEFPKIDPGAQALMTALREQLGLALESARGPIDMLVIDRVQRPTEN